MLTDDLKGQINQLWDEMWTGGIANPLTAIEQISYLLYARLLDLAETRAEKKAARTGRMERRLFSDRQQHLRWSRFKHVTPAEELLRVVRDEAFPHLRGLDQTFLADAQLLIQKPSLLVSAINKVDALPLTEGDTKGDLYEQLLAKLTTAGINGQFRTPRHIIKLMVTLLDPRPDEVVADPACGTAGFLVATLQYLTEKYTSPEGRLTEGEHTLFTGDLLEPHREHLRTKLLNGFDFDATMLRIAAMNLILHGIESPNIYYQDTLASSFAERYAQLAEGGVDVILANPPFKGSLDTGDVAKALTQKVNTRKTELLFVALMLRMLRRGGRCATIVPDGVLFGSSNAHRDLRKMLIDDHQVDGVISLPPGVFKPYAGVSTAILLFTREGRTDQVFFYDVKTDGFTLDDKRTPRPDEDDTKGLPAIWHARNSTAMTDRRAKGFFVPVDEIRGNEYDLSINRYKVVDHEEVETEAPGVILARLKVLEAEIARDIAVLEGLVG